MNQPSDTWTPQERSAVRAYLRRHRRILSASPGLSDMIDAKQPFGAWSHMRTRHDVALQHLQEGCEGSSECSSHTLTLREMMMYTAALEGIERLLNPPS